MKKEKQNSSLANNRTSHKQKNTNKCKTMTSSTPHDDQLSLVLVLSIIPKYRSPSSIRSHLHPDLYLGLVHTEKKSYTF